MPSSSSRPFSMERTGTEAGLARTLLPAPCARPGGLAGTWEGQRAAQQQLQNENGLQLKEGGPVWGPGGAPCRARGPAWACGGLAGQSPAPCVPRPASASALHTPTLQGSRRWESWQKIPEGRAGRSSCHHETTQGVLRRPLLRAGRETRQERVWAFPGVSLPSITPSEGITVTLPTDRVQIRPVT